MKQTLQIAVLKLLRPLVRILLRNGVPFGAFADLARWVYVDVALHEFGLSGRKPSDSRASIVTGLSRKEIRRLRDMSHPGGEESIERYNRAARVISGWVRDRRFCDAKGNPKALPIEQGPVSFQDLVKQFSGDVPARAILDELVHVGAVETTPDKQIRLLERAYVPATGEGEKLGILGSDVADLITTIDNNLQGAPRNPRFQRKVAYDNLPVEALAEFKKISAHQGQQLLEKLDRYLASHDRDTAPEAQGSGRVRAGVGIYYFEETLEEAPAGPAREGSKR
ncbi:hypothetical protein DESUT3_38130 [Desulfuromonas versatilis]|uniref:Uncharacterized protein n=1 Tax=Desulfuromonas versatilis TaxID=2802975 RepID=A0ABM8I265_9BACT|nr:DUF6502 family protein [Desulfuromonas versatilis]BCR06744.1 hypothetical protein DESUT3_38130 [Desulfuromonas versatilis]